MCNIDRRLRGGCKEGRPDVWGLPIDRYVARRITVIDHWAVIDDSCDRSQAPASS
jgi:hypothetical protein